MLRRIKNAMGKIFSRNKYVASQIQHGFTLIELLVVVALVVILAGMLTLTLAKTKEEVEQEQCINNLKQLGLIISMYTNDYDGWYPPCSMPVNNYWFEATWVDNPLRSYIQSGYKSDGTFNVYNIATCPTYKSYYMANGWCLPSLIGGYPWRKKSKNPSPGTIFMLADGTVWGAKDQAADISLIRYCHTLNANILFSDGHVESRMQNSVTAAMMGPYKW